MITVESNIEEQDLLVSAGGAKSVELVVKQDKDELELSQYPANITIINEGVDEDDIGNTDTDFLAFYIIAKNN